MYPHTTYDKQNGLAYIAFSDNTIQKSMESEDELFVLDIDKNGQLVGIEVLSVPRLQKKFAAFSHSKEGDISSEMIPSYVLPFVHAPYQEA